MENASKALIIAGAILLSILIISLGIVVIRQAQGTINNANLNTEEIQAFNGRFDSYLGKGRTNSDMNALVTAIAASNGAQSKVANQHYIKITNNVGTTYSSGTDSVTATSSGVTGTYPTFSAGVTYKAESKIGTSGYIEEVIINKE